MNIDQQIAELKAAGQLHLYPALAKLAAESDKASAAISQLNTERAQAEAEQAARDEVHPFSLSTEPSAPDDIAILCFDREPRWESPVITPDGVRIAPRVSGSLSFAPAWFASALDMVPGYARSGWASCTPLMALDLFRTTVGANPAEHAQRFAQVVLGVRSVPMLLAIWRRLSVPGSSTDIVRAARVVASALSAQGHDPNNRIVMPSQAADHATEEREADRIWSMVIGGAQLPALPRDPQTEIERAATASLIASQAVSQARLVGAAQ